MPHPLLTPTLIVRHVGDVTAEVLARRGLRAVVCDLDNTLVPWREEQTTEEVTAWLLTLKAAGIGVCIASNTHRLSRLNRVADRLGILHVPGNAGKPGTRGLRRALTLLNAEPSESAMVGDQVFTDIVAGNRLGLTTILVNPLSSREFIGTRLISRTAERIILRGPLQRAR
jgi:uncharacterized protein